VTGSDAPRCGAATRTGRPCRNPPAPGAEMCGPHLRRAHAAFTEERAERLVGLLRAGNTAGAAARATGISERTLREWLRLGAAGAEPYAELRARVEAARGEGEALRVTQIAAAAAEDWRAGAWLLERRFGREDDAGPPLDTAEVAARAGARARAEAEATLAALGEPLGLNAGAVDRYAAAVAAWASLEAQWEHAGRPGVALGGATGSAHVPHPLLAQIALARREAAQLATLLGLDPTGRLRLARHIAAGRPPGAASAPDRAAGPPRRRLRAVE
jgi:Phage terminase, small subunit